MIREILVYIILSLAGATGLVFVSKYVLNFILRRNSNYYENREKEEERLMLERAGIKAEDMRGEETDEFK